MRRQGARSLCWVSHNKILNWGQSKEDLTLAFISLLVY